MASNRDKQAFIQFAHKIGYDVEKDIAEHVDVHYQRIFDFLPELVVFVASYTVKKNFSRYTTAPRLIKDSICFFFLNTIEQSKTNSSMQKVTPYVSVFPSATSHQSHFKKGTRKEIVSIFISTDYLKSFFETRHQAVSVPVRQVQ